MKVDIKVEGLKRMMKRLDPKIVKKASAKTLNDMTIAVRTDISKTIRERYTLKAQRIKKDIKIIAKATPSRLQAIISFLRKPPGLQHYRARRLKKGGVTVEVIKGQRKKVRGGFIPLAHRLTGVYRRIGKGRGDVKRLPGPSVGGMFKAVDGIKRVRKVLSERMNRTFWRHYNYLRSKVKR